MNEYMRTQRAITAPEILEQAAKTIRDRAAERDTESERSMKRTVDAFNALTGNSISERDGWLFMAVLKMARALNTPNGKPDDYVDGGAYFALAGESVAEVETATRHVHFGEFGGVDLECRYRWIAQDAGGAWHAFATRPAVIDYEGEWRSPDMECLHIFTAKKGNPEWRDTLRELK